MSRCILGRALAGRAVMWPDWAELVLKQLKRQLLHSPQRASAPDNWHVCYSTCVHLLRVLGARAGLHMAGLRLRSAAARQRRDSGCMTVHGSLYSVTQLNVTLELSPEQLYTFHWGPQ